MAEAPSQFNLELVSKLKKELRCPVCYKLPKEPKTLPCGHLICSDCIDKDKKLLKTNWVMSCPMCRTECVVDRPITNYTIKSTISMLKTIVDASADATANRHTCKHSTMELTMLKQVRKRCHHCDELFCETCQFRHMEELRMEILTKADMLLERHKQLSEPALQEKVVECRSLLQSDAEQVMRSFELAASALRNQLEKDLERIQKRILASTNKAVEHQLDTVQKAVERATQSNVDSNVLPKIDSIRKSLFGSKISDLNKAVELHKDVDEWEKAINSVEKLTTSTVGALSFDFSLEYAENLLVDARIGGVRVYPNREDKS